MEEEIVVFNRCTQSLYNRLQNKGSNELFYCMDTGNCYLGELCLFEKDAFTAVSLNGKVVAFSTHGQNGTAGSKTLDLSSFLQAADIEGLAIDAEVVHKTGDETVSGDKTFTDDVSFQNCIVFPKGGQNDEDVMIFNGTMGVNDHVGVLALESESGSVTVRGVAEPVQSNDAANKDYVDGKSGNSKLFYGTCPTAGATATKVCTVEPFPLDPNGKPLVGTVIAVKFSNTTSATNPRLNVNGTGAAPIWYNASQVTTNTSVVASAGRVIYYLWDGTYWVWVSWSYDSNTTYSAMTLKVLLAGTDTANMLISAKLIGDNFDIDNRTVKVRGKTINVPEEVEWTELDDITLLE